jgi:hypothetical protein
MGARIVVVLLLAQLGTLSGSAPPVACPCSDPALCKPLSPIPQPKDEVVAFPAWEIYGGGYNDTVEKLYDWSKITTIAPFQPYDLSAHAALLHSCTLPLSNSAAAANSHPH